MPGLHLVIGDECRTKLTAVERTLPSLKHDPDYRSQVIFRTDSTIVAASGYPDYPVTIFDDEELLLVIEGMIYGLDREQLGRALQQLAGFLEPGRRHDNQTLVDWLFDQPGDYLILIHHKRHGQWSLLNDPLNRLPFYVNLGRERAIMSRELRFVSSLQTQPAIDRLGLAQFLMFGYQCGTRTILTGVDSLPGASLIEWNDRIGEIKSTRLYEFDYGVTEDSRDLKRAADKLTDLFIDATCKMSRKNTVLGLSGGLDSRPVAAALVKAKVPFEALTFLDVAGAARGDVDTARRVAEALGINWSVYELKSCTGVEIEKIMLMKGGANFTASAVSLAFMKRIERTFRKDGVYLSGDGGGKTIPLNVPPCEFRTAQATAQFAILRHALLPGRLVTALTGLRKNDLLDDITDVISTYPEPSFAHKYLHYRLSDFNGRWSYEGEDCNRYHLWSAAPYMHLPMFVYSMSIPARLKAERNLYHQFLTNLSPAAAEIEPVGSRYKLGTAVYRASLRTKANRTRYPRLLNLAKRFLKPAIPVRNTAVLTDCIRRQYASSEALKELLDCKQLEHLLERANRISAEGLHNVLTATSAILLHLGQPMLFEEFADKEFD
ncbi:MAG TPA: asparagine synthase-related protein [candidate division Zixibacteria bacterium]|nr:asparagine synthase-related protein [candidate division Zixibacteria bacterium]